jgi:hypothetical protein
VLLALSQSHSITFLSQGNNTFEKVPRADLTVCRWELSV